MRLVAGIFVGGASRRMGGRPKGWLLAPRDSRRGEAGEPAGAETRVSVLERTVALARTCCRDVFLVGRAEAYAALGVPAIDDATTAVGPAEGPLAGLVALLERVGDGGAIALACDMPYLTRAMIERLAAFAPEAAAVAARTASPHEARLGPHQKPEERAVWSPLFARYDAARAGPVARAKLERGERSLRAVLESVDTRELPLSPEERLALKDWDTPADVDDVGTGP